MKPLDNHSCYILCREKNDLMAVSDLVPKRSRSMAESSSGKPRACDACRKKKIKCMVVESEGPSCTNCLNRGFQCTFEHPAPHKRPKKSYVDALEGRIAKLEALVGRLAPGYDYNKDIGEPLSAETFESSRKRKQDGGKADADADSESFKEESPPSDNDTDNELDNKMRCICVTNTSPDWNRYYGASSNPILFNAAQEYCGLPNMQLESDKVRYKFWMEEIRMREEKESDYAPPILPGDYPHDLDYLVELYFDNVNNFFPLLHKSTFLAQLQYRKLDKGFAGVVMLVCAIASKYSDNPDTLSDTNDKLFAGRQFYLTYKEKCLRNHVCAPRLEDIQARILLQVYLQSTPFSKACWSINGETLALLQDVGYHRKRVSDEPIDDELRRRAFYCSFVQDKATSALFGRCGIISKCAFDVQPPAALPDEVGRPMELTIKYFKELISLYTIQDEILGSLYSFRFRPAGGKVEESVKQSVTLVSKANERLHEWIENIDSSLKYNQQCADNFTHTLMANLRVGYHVLQIFTYRNYMTMPRRSSFRSISLSVTTQASINIINLWQTKMARSTHHTHTDYLLSTSIFSACLVLVISACECKKYAGVPDIGQHGPEMRYIELALGVMRSGEYYNIYNGKEVDLLVQLLSACGLRVDGTALPDSAEYETQSTSSLSQNTPPSDTSQSLYLDMLNSIRQFGNVDVAVPDPSMQPFDNLNGLLDGVPETDALGVDWKSFVDSLYN